MRRLTAVFAGLLMLISFAGASHNPEIIVPPPDSRNESPALAFSGDGTLWLAWSSFKEGRCRLSVSSRKNDSWTDIEYPDGSTADQVEPQWMMGGSGRPALVYSVCQDKRWKIRYVERTEAGWGEIQDLGSGKRPCGVNCGRQQWAAWEENGAIEIRRMGGAERYSRVLQPDHPDLSYSHPTLGVGSQGQVWLAFCASRTGYQSVLLKRLDSEQAEIMRVDEGRGINREPRISLDGRGRIWIVYEVLEENPDPDDFETPEIAGATYVMDRTYRVKFPSRSVVVTDGERWWKPVRSPSPAVGLRPNIHCAGDGTVWLLSRSYVGNERPRREFFPLCESLGPSGWTNHDVLALEKRGYKEMMPMAESPEGDVWTAWIPNNRERLGFQDNPSWTFTDADDFLAVTRLPEPGGRGYPQLTALSRSEINLPGPKPVSRYVTEYNGEELKVFFGDLHQHSEFSGCGRLNGSIDQNQHYTRFIRGLDFMSTIDHSEHLNDHNWHAHQLVSERNNSPGSFVTFSGFEWTSEFDAGGNLYRGHYNAIFRDIGEGDFYYSASDPRTNTPGKLWEALKKAVGGPDNVLTFPHHPSRRMAWISWNYYDPDFVPLIEIAQSRGSYEYEGSFSLQVHANDCSRVSGHYIQDGLARGMRWGFIAGGDHGGRQLAAVFAPELTRESLFRNLKSRRTYATNGERMFMDVRINGRMMGEEFVLETDIRTIDIHVRGTAPLVQVDLFRNGRIIRQANPDTMAFETTWTDGDPLLKRENYYYLRAVQKNGGQAWASPIWIINPDIPGRFRFQVGGDELQVIYPAQEVDVSVLMHNEGTEAVTGTVRLDVPSGWVVKESAGIPVKCPAEAWRYAVFSVKAPAAGVTDLCLPELVASFDNADGSRLESPLFIVASPTFLSRERKAVLIDARKDLSGREFLEFFNKIGMIWRKEDQ